MAIENERKYILSLTPDDIDMLVDDYGGKEQYIQQAYIGDARIRSKIEGDLVKFFFTWKKRRKDSSQIEIETEITERDFMELWDFATTFVYKVRIKVYGYGVVWDVDFLFSDTGYNDHYLTVAEVEMPENMNEPKFLPDFVKNNLVYEVPRKEEAKWSNQQLADKEKVQKMVKKVSKVSDDEAT